MASATTPRSAAAGARGPRGDEPGRQAAPTAARSERRLTVASLDRTLNLQPDDLRQPGAVNPRQPRHERRGLRALAGSPERLGQRDPQAERPQRRVRRARRVEAFVHAERTDDTSANAPKTSARTRHAAARSVGFPDCAARSRASAANLPALARSPVASAILDARHSRARSRPIAPGPQPAGRSRHPKGRRRAPWSRSLAHVARSSRVHSGARSSAGVSGARPDATCECTEAVPGLLRTASASTGTARARGPRTGPAAAATARRRQSSRLSARPPPPEAGRHRSTRGPANTAAHTAPSAARARLKCSRARSMNRNASAGCPRTSRSRPSASADSPAAPSS